MPAAEMGATIYSFFIYISHFSLLISHLNYISLTKKIGRNVWHSDFFY